MPFNESLIKKEDELIKSEFLDTPEQSINLSISGETLNDV